MCGRYVTVYFIENNARTEYGMTCCVRTTVPSMGVQKGCEPFLVRSFVSNPRTTPLNFLVFWKVIFECFFKCYLPTEFLHHFFSSCHTLLRLYHNLSMLIKKDHVG